MITSNSNPFSLMQSAKYSPIFAICAFVDARLPDISRLRFLFFYCHLPQFLPLGTGVFIFFCIIGHSFSPANVIFIALFLLLFVVGRLHKQGKLLTAIYIAVVFFTFIPRIHDNSLYRILLA